MKGILKMSCSIPKIGESLAELHPVIAKEWSNRNGNITPFMIKPNRHEKYYWEDEYHHEWYASPNQRVGCGSGCPICNKHSTSYPEQFLYWAFKQLYVNTENRQKVFGLEYDITIPEIPLFIEYSAKNWHEGKEKLSKKKRELCKNHNIDYIEIIADRNCNEIEIENDYIRYNPHYNSNKTLINVLQIIFKKYNQDINQLDINDIQNKAFEYSKGLIELSKRLSTIRPDLANEFVEDLNNGLKSENLTPGSSIEVIWECPNCHITYTAKVCSRNRGTGCPICKSKKIIEGFNDLQTRRPDITNNIWDFDSNDKINLKPTKVAVNSHIYAYFRCQECGYLQYTSISDKTKKKPNGCPVCANKIVIAGYNDLQTKFPKLVAKLWDFERNSIEPTQITPGSNKLVYIKGKDIPCVLNDLIQNGKRSKKFCFNYL